MIRPVQKDLFAVIGNPVAHSLSPAMMNAVFLKLGMACVYVALEVDALEEDLETLHRMGIRGMSVTLPHKETAYRLAKAVDNTAQAIGAVNTLRRLENGWEGCNTDWLGSNRSLEQVTSLEGKRSLILGAGGVARAVAYGLKRSGASVTVSNRTVKRGEALAEAFHCDFIPLDELKRSPEDHGFQVVVQCTSAGLMGKESSPLVPESFFQRGMVVLDTVYRPLWTPFMLTAQKAGCIMVPGLEMLLHQGVAQLEWWLGLQHLPSEGIQVMRDTLKRALENE
ncbi:shikimate dehydrogenase [Desulforhabdus amnigena]|jgi:shikimate dehydrogenase|uniref:Shikimate dehydrogenase (NADP(+)) n=1 Tax=Desulforhabdus amnigena TaxID=40218 RepID=A0A9W6FV66_9BACT|nr:shikimate dehydrogenase [Desulforhabdus amnigena]NLJ28160.1 shikimate dehydrogenase [Deltaproteobacteria bacterium]GLI35448.1 shikimate dehydrogenase [Desulforhabdus amnigena]